jgi:hypothetical protein
MVSIACQGAANGNGGRGLPALAQAAHATCRLARGAATRRGSFLTKIFAVVFSSISLGQVVSCVKNSLCSPRSYFSFSRLLFRSLARLQEN